MLWGIRRLVCVGQQHLPTTACKASRSSCFRQCVLAARQRSRIVSTSHTGTDDTPDPLNPQLRLADYVGSNIYKFIRHLYIVRRILDRVVGNYEGTP